MQTVKYLVELQKVDVNTKGNNDMTPLHWACSIGSFPLVQYLISQGAEVNAQDVELNTPIHIATEKGFLQIVEYLASNGADLTLRNQKGDTPIHIAAMIEDNIQIVQYLIEKKNVNVNITGNYDMTPLHIACNSGNLPLVKYLISKGANINAVDKFQNWTPLHVAVFSNKVEIVKYLVSQGANDIIKDAQGRYPFYLTENDEIKKILSEYRKQINEKMKRKKMEEMAITCG